MPTCPTSAAQRLPLHRMRPCWRSTYAWEIRSNENRGHSGEKEQHAPHARHSEAVSSGVASAKWSFDPEVDRGLFPPIALDLVLDSLSLVSRPEPGPLNGGNVDEHIFA